MNRDIFFSNSGATRDDRLASFFSGPYLDFCTHLRKCAIEAGNQQMEEVAIWAGREGHLLTMRMDASMLELIRKAAENMLNVPILLPEWEMKAAQDPYWESYCAQQGRTSDEMTEIVRSSTEYGLKLVIRKMDEMIAERKRSGDK